MWFEIVKWGSVVLCWFAMALNIWGFVRGLKIHRESERLNEEFRRLIEERFRSLTNPEE